MNKPDPERFAKIVVMGLTNIFAELLATRMLVKEIARQLQIPDIETKIGLSQEKARKTADELSNQLLKGCGLK